MSPQEIADQILVIWQEQRRQGIRPEQRRIPQDNDPNFYERQLKMISEHMGLDR
jgi:hypothetical protein